MEQDGVGTVQFLHNSRREQPGRPGGSTPGTGQEALSDKSNMKPVKSIQPSINGCHCVTKKLVGILFIFSFSLDLDLVNLLWKPNLET